MGDMMIKGINPYLTLNYNSYPPLAIYLEVAAINLSQLLHIPFYILTKVLPNSADILAGVFIYWYLYKKGTKPIIASFWSLVFLLNPISIIISSAHGQIDSIPTFLVILSIFLLSFYQSKLYIFLSALLLGLAVAVKPNPLILLPFFIIFLKSNLKTRICFIFLTILPVVILFLPFLQDNPQYILQKLLIYSGSNDFGLPAVIKTSYFKQNATFELPFNDQLLLYTKIIFLIGLSLIITLYIKSKKIITGCLAAYLLFLAVYFGISAQYLSWVIPLAILDKDKWVIPFSISGFIALLAFYLFFNPAILLVQFSNIQPYQSQFLPLFPLTNLVFWTITFLWLLKVCIRIF